MHGAPLDMGGRSSGEMGGSSVLQGSSILQGGGREGRSTGYSARGGGVSRLSRCLVVSLSRVVASLSRGLAVSFSQVAGGSEVCRVM